MRESKLIYLQYVIVWFIGEKIVFTEILSKNVRANFRRFHTVCVCLCHILENRDSYFHDFVEKFTQGLYSNWFDEKIVCGSKFLFSQFSAMRKLRKTRANFSKELQCTLNQLVNFTVLNFIVSHWSDFTCNQFCLFSISQCGNYGI